MIKFKMTFVFICLALIIIFLRINVNASSIQFNDAKVKLSDSTTVNLNIGENSVIKNEIYVCDNEIEINNYNVYLNVNNNDDTIYNEVLPIEDDISNVDVVTICGYLKWLGRSQDGTIEKTHSLFELRVDFYTTSSNEYLASAISDENGFISTTIERTKLYNEELFGYDDIECKIVLQNGKYNITDLSNVVYEKKYVCHYSENEDLYDCSLLVENSENVDKALQIDQFLKLGYKFIESTKYSESISFVTLKYPYIGNDDLSSHYTYGEIYIETNDYNECDIILHELGHHFFRNILGRFSVGGKHSFGEVLTDKTNNIMEACYLSWNEAIATFFSIGLQKSLNAGVYDIYNVGDQKFCKTSFAVNSSSVKMNGNDHDEYAIGYFLYNICFRNNVNDYTVDDVIELICDNEIKTFTTFLTTLYSLYDSPYEIHRKIGLLLEKMKLSISCDNTNDLNLGDFQFELNSSNDFSSEIKSFDIDVMCELYIYSNIGEVLYKSDPMSCNKGKNYIDVPQQMKIICRDYKLGYYSDLYFALVTYIDCGEYDNYYYSTLKLIEIEKIYTTMNTLNYEYDFMDYGDRFYYYLEVTPQITNTYEFNYYNCELMLNDNDSYMMIMDSMFNILTDVNGQDCNVYLNDFSTVLNVDLYKDYKYYVIIFDCWENWGNGSKSNLKINISENNNYSNFNDYFINSYQMIGKNIIWNTFEFKQYGNYSFSFSIGDKYEGLVFYELYKINNGVASVINGGIVTSDNRGRVNMIDANPGDQFYFYIEYSSMENTLVIDIMRSTQASFTIIPDNYNIGGGSVGTEVTLNNGNYGSNIMTVGYTRCMFLDYDAPSVLRQDYYWFVNNEKASISEFGTLLAKETGYVTVYAIYKYNYSIYGTIIIKINDDSNNESIPLSFGLDVRENVSSQGSFVSQYGGLPLNVNNYDGTFMCPITINTTRLICLGGDSPSPYLQNFVWTSSSNSVIVSSFGTITAIEQFDSIVTITGVYKYNERFIVTINLVYV